MGKIIAAVLMIPFGIISDLSRIGKGKSGLDLELSRAANGVFAIVAAFLILRSNVVSFVPADYRGYVLLGIYALIPWGAFGLIIGAARSRHFRDGHLLTLAIVRVGVGIAICCFASSWPRYYNWQLWCWDAAMVVVVFCAVTGLTKTVLLLRPLPQIQIPPVNPMPLGTSDFDDGLR
jgi:hypothetical protein